MPKALLLGSALRDAHLTLGVGETAAALGVGQPWWEDEGTDFLSTGCDSFVGLHKVGYRGHQ